MSQQHPNLPNSGFPTSTTFTLGTESGVILIRAHTTGNQLHIFTASVERENFDINFHWTTWSRQPGNDATDITHEALIVPLDGEEHILRTTVQHQQSQFHYAEPPQSPQQSQGHMTIPQEETGSEESHVTDSGYHSSGSYHPPIITEAQGENQ